MDILTQEKLVNVAIDIMIYGENNHTNYTYGYTKTYQDHKMLWFRDLGRLHYYESNITEWGESFEKNPIHFDKKVKNMAMLCVLLRDWDRMNGYKNWYKTWVERKSQ